jgi:ParB/RepB/Spo0J family partition protein
LPDIEVEKIKVGERFRKDLGDIDRLAESIREVGLLHPIVVDEEYNLVAGYRRLEACKRLGWRRVPVHIVPLKDLAKGELHENTVRKSFTIEEIVAIKRALEPKLREEAEKRMKAGRPCADSAQGMRGKTRDIIAKFVGVSHDTLAKMEKIVEVAEKDPETYGRILEAVNSGKMSVAYAYKMVKRREVVEPPPLPEGEFDVIYADPPWEYYLPLRGSPDMHYKTMSTEEICRLKIPAAEDAVLFLWATNPKLEDALTVMKAWGFQYKTNMVWVKDRIGTGYYFRGQHELLLVGTKGDMPTPLEEDRPPSVLYAPAGEHSEKPEAVYELIEKMYPNRRYLELFARKRRRGWTAWGDQLAEKAQV